MKTALPNAGAVTMAELIRFSRRRAPLRRIGLMVAFLTSSLLVVDAMAQSIPPLVNYQGRLANSDGTPFPTADYELRFSIYENHTNVNSVWGPQVFDGAPNAGHGPRLPVVQGYFNVVLGPVDTQGRPILGAFASGSRFVEVTVSGRALPRQQILTTPFAFVAGGLAAGPNGRVQMSNSLSLKADISNRSDNDMAIYLYGPDANYGLGVQPDTTYFRSGTQFAWYKGGTHRWVLDDPGDGGTTLMRLDVVGDLHVHGLFQSASDRNIKRSFQEVEPRDVLEKLAALPIRTWAYTNDPQSTRHIGPVAQDFSSAFGVGRNDREIATVDADGVSFAAIQALHAVVKEQQKEINNLKQALRRLQSEMDSFRKELREDDRLKRTALKN